MKRIAILLVCVGAFALAGCGSPIAKQFNKNDNFTERLQRGQHYYIAGDYSTAAEEFRKLAEENPAHAQRCSAVYWLALSWMNMRMYSDARSLLLGLEGNPNAEEIAGDVKLGIAECFFNEKNYLLAKKYYSSALVYARTGKVRGDYVLDKLIKCCNERGETEEAKQYLAALKAGYPASPLLASIAPASEDEGSEPDSASAGRGEDEGRVPSLGGTTNNRAGGKGSFYVQTGVFSDRNNALKQKKQLSNANYEADMSEASSYGKTMYSVMVGPYGTYDEASRISNKLRGEGYKGAFVKRK